MPTFPRTEPDIIVLAQQVLNGLQNNPKLAAAPIDKGVFTPMLNDFIAKRDQIIADEAALSEKYAEKTVLLKTLTDSMKQDIAYLEALTNKDVTELATIGWGVGGAPVKQVPGQPRSLEIITQTEGSVFLDWKNPSDGGNVTAYRVERRERPAGTWETVSATSKSEALLTNQPRGKEWEFRAIAFNATGDSIPSNTVTAVL